MKPVRAIGGRTLVAVAVKSGRARLIDNLIVRGYLSSLTR